jgi:hypothetical protein
VKDLLRGVPARRVDGRALARGCTSIKNAGIGQLHCHWGSGFTGSWRRPAHALGQHRALAVADDCLLAGRVGEFLRDQSTSSRSATASPEAERFLLQCEESDKLTRGVNFS